jgi:WD40 repeat protein
MVVLSALGCAASAQKVSLRETKRFQAEDVLIMRVQFSPTGDRLLTASAGGEAGLWTLQGEDVGRFVGQRPPMFAANFTPGAEHIVTTGYDGTVRLWSLQSGHVHVLHLIKAAVTDAVFCGSSEVLVVSSDAGVGELLHVDINQDERSTLLAEIVGPGTARRVACDAPHQRFAVTFDSGVIELSDLSGRKRWHFQTGQNRLNAIAFSRNGNLLLTASTDGSVKVWTSRGKPVVTLAPANAGWVNEARFSPDDKTVVIATDDGRVRLYSLSGALLLEQQVSKARVTTAGFSRDGKLLAAGTSAGELVLYEVKHD